MKNKFKFLFKESYFKKIRSKTFLITNILLFAGIILLSNLQQIIHFFGGDFEKEKYIYLEVANDEDHLIYDLVAKEVNSLAEFTKQNIVVTNEEKEDLEFELLINLEDGKFKVTNTYYTANQVKRQLVKQAIDNSYNEYIKLKNPEVFETFDKLNKALEIEDINKIEDEFDDFGYFVSMALSLIIFFTVLFAMQFIGGEIIEEKSSKMIETVLSNVDPLTHLASKVLSVLCFLITQLGLALTYGLIGFMMASKGLMVETDVTGVDIGSVIGPILDILPRVVLSTIPFIIVGYLLFALLIAMFASMATSIQDYNQFTTPVMLSLLLAFYLSMFSSLFEGSLFIKILGYIPFLSPILAPVLYNNGAYNLIELIISFSLIILLIIVIFKYVMQVYKISLLDYSEDSLFKKIKSVRQKLKSVKKAN